MTLRIGHRGAPGYLDENTIEGFKKALALKCDMIEFDVRKCKSGEIILMHDRRVTRATNGRGFVRNLEYKDLKKLKTNNGYKIPTLDQALQYLKGKCKIIIHIKDKKSYPIIVALVEKHKLTKDVILSSYKTRVLKKIKQIDSRIKLGLVSDKRVGLLRNARKLGCYSVHPHFFARLTKKFIQKLQKEFKVYVWTVNWKGSIRRLKKKKADGIMSDYPDLI
tara:strand:- start:65 stop:727 length:663 start_codon:yes stop_codon:yes gene_type:complete